MNYGGEYDSVKAAPVLRTGAAFLHLRNFGGKTPDIFGGLTDIAMFFSVTEQENRYNNVY